MSYGQRSYIFPEIVRLFARKRLNEACGFLCILCFLALMCVVISYSSSDSSMNTWSSMPYIENTLGEWGATVADIVMQFFGFGALVIGLPLLRWAYDYLRQAPPRNILPQAATALLSCLSLSVGVSLLFNITQEVQAVADFGRAPTALGHMALALTTQVSVAATLVLRACFSAFSVAAGLGGILYSSRISAHAFLNGIYRAGRGVVNGAAKVGGVMRSWLSFGGATNTQLASGRQAMARQQKHSPAGRGAMAPLSVKGGDKLAGGIQAPESSGLQALRRCEKTSIEALEGTQSAISGQGGAQTGTVQKALQLGGAEAYYHLPDLRLLQDPDKKQRHKPLTPAELEANMQQLTQVLADYGVKGEITGAQPGPVVTLYELLPAPGIKSSRVIGLADDIARSMSALSARIAVVPGQNIIGIELPNEKRQTVYLKDLLGDQKFLNDRGKLTITLGKNIGGDPVFTDLARMPHMIVAGTTGSGKSVGINAMILSLLYRHSPDTCRLIMIDPKMLEFSMYNDIPHLLTPVVTDPKKALYALKWAVKEMENRYRLMSQIGVRNIEGFNAVVHKHLAEEKPLTHRVQTGFDSETGRPQFEEQALELKPFPYIVVVVDEMADLMLVAGKDIEAAVQRLAQMARAAGIHVIMATQRPSVDVITGTIKANFPTRISFQVTSKFDSRTILGDQGAEQLLGRGDMLFMESGGRVQRIHGPFVSDSEVENVVRHVKAQGEPDYSATVTEEVDDGFNLAGGGLSQGEDDQNTLYNQAVEIVRRDRKASTSYIQRKLSIGYNRAARFIEQMEQQGLISAANHVGKREILMDEAS